MHRLPAFLPIAGSRLLRPRTAPLCARSPRTMTVTPASTPASAPAPAPTPSAAPDLVQYVVVRTDLGWGTGALIAQGIHAALRVTHGADACAHTAAYVAPDAANQMTTVVLRAESGEALRAAAAKCEAAGVRCALWTEQPEDVVSALASRPGPRAELKPLFRGFRLLR